MTDLVVDASAILDYLVSGERSTQVGQQLAATDVAFAPDLIGLEVLSGLARLLRADELPRSAAQAAFEAWNTAPIRRVPLGVLEHQVWQLRDRLRISDAYYAAGAIRLRLPLLTSDARLARAGVPGLTVLLVS